MKKDQSNEKKKQEPIEGFFEALQAEAEHL